ncbi:hypothetical protein CIB84_017266, partial [Bambusicola thoracicus]
EHTHIHIILILCTKHCTNRYKLLTSPNNPRHRKTITLPMWIRPTRVSPTPILSPILPHSHLIPPVRPRNRPTPPPPVSYPTCIPNNNPHLSHHYYHPPHIRSYLRMNTRWFR